MAQSTHVRVGPLDASGIWRCRQCGAETAFYTIANEAHSKHIPVAFPKSLAPRDYPEDSGSQYRYYPAQDGDITLSLDQVDLELRVAIAGNHMAPRRVQVTRYGRYSRP